MSIEIGAVKTIVGKFWIHSANGESHLAVVGEMLHQGDRIVGDTANAANATLSLDLVGNTTKNIVLGANDVLTLDQTFLKDVLTMEDASVKKASLVAAWDGPSEELSITIEDNKDALALADMEMGDGETAAGGAATDGQIRPAHFDERTGAFGDARSSGVFTVVNGELNGVSTGTDTPDLNDRPLVFDITATVNEALDGTNTITGQLVASDADLTDTHTFFAVDGSLTVNGIALEGVAFELNTDGTYTISGDFNHLAVGENAVISFQYYAVDNGLPIGEVHDSLPATVTLTITGTNDQPVVENVTITDFATETNGAETFSGQLAVSDQDLSDTHTFYQSGSATVESSSIAVVNDFSVVVDEDGAYHVNGNFDHLADGETATVTFQYYAVDSSVTQANGESNTSEVKTVTLTVTGTNDQPIVSDVNVNEASSGTGIIENIDGNNNLANAYNIDGQFVVGANPDIQNSETTPYVSINGIGNNAKDLYEFTVTTAGSTGVFDIDYGMNVGGSFDPWLNLYDASGIRIASNDDSSTSAGDGGSVHGYDSFLTYTFANPGTYYIEVARYYDTTINNGGTYTLQVSLENAISGLLLETNGVEEIYTGTLVLTTDLDTTDTHTFQVAAGTTPVSSVAAVTDLAVVVNANGTYTVNGNFDALADGETATVTFQYTATDDSGTAAAVSAPKTVTLTVTGTNDQPIVSAVTETATETNGVEEIFSGQLALTTDLDTTDTHTFQQTGTAAVVTNGGSTAVVTDLAVTVNPNGTYTVNGNFEALADGETATVTFQYTATDDSGTTTAVSVEKTVTLTVTGTNDQPIVTDVTATATETNGAETFSGQLAVSDLDTTDAHTFQQTGTASVVTNSAAVVTDFAVAVATDGSYTVNGNFDALADGETATVTFTYTATDDSGTATAVSAEKTVTLTVTGTNDQPIVSDVNVNGTGSGEVVGLDALNQVSYSYGLSGQVQIFTATETHLSHIDVNIQNGNTGSFKVQITDLSGTVVLFTSETVTVTGVDQNIVSANLNVDLVQGQQYKVSYIEAGSLQGDVTRSGVTGDGDGIWWANRLYDWQDLAIKLTYGSGATVILETNGVEEIYAGQLALTTDLDTTDTHTFQQTGTAAVVTNGGSTAVVTDLAVAIATDGSYTVNGNFDALADGETATVTFQYTATDDSGADNATSEPKTVTLTVTGTNDQPVVSNIAIVTTLVSENFETGASGWSNNLTTNGGELTNFLGRFAGTGGNEGISKTFDFGVGLAGKTVTINFDMYEIDSWDGEAFKVFVNGSVVSSDSMWVDSHYGERDGGTSTSANIFNGWGAEDIHHYSLQAIVGVDGKVKLGFGTTLDQGISDESWGIDNLTIAVSNTVFETNGTQEISAGQLTVTDLDTTDTYTFQQSGITNVITSSGVAVNAQVEITSTGAYTVSGNFDALAAGETATVTFSYTATDDSGTATAVSEIKTVTLTVVGTNDSPVILDTSVISGIATEAGNLDDGTAVAATVATGTMVSSDVDNGATATWSGNATGTYGSFAIDPATGVWTYTVDAAAGSAADKLAEGETKVETFAATVTDDKGAIATQTVTITVTGTNDSPVATVDVGATDENTSVTIDVLNNDTDIDNGHTFTLTGVNSAKGTVSILDNKLVFEANAADFDHLAQGVNEDVVVTYTMSDEFGATSTSTATITVTGTNDRPVVSDVNANGTGSGVSNIEEFSVFGPESGITIQVNGNDVTTSNQNGYFYSSSFQGSYGVDGYALNVQNPTADALVTFPNPVDSFSFRAGAVDFNQDDIEVVFTDGSTQTFLIEPTGGSSVDGSSHSRLVEFNAPTGKEISGFKILAGGDWWLLDGITFTGSGATVILETNDLETIYTGTLVLTTDLDTTDTHTFQVAAGTTPAVTTSSTAVVTDLAVTVNPNGSYTVNGNFDALADGETATVTFQYTATDDSGTATAVSEPKTVTLTVTGTNDTPVATDDSYLGANLIVDGSFENPDIGGNFTTIGTGKSIGAWHVDSGSIDLINGYWGASEGGQSLDMSGNSAGTISQSFATVIGHTYTVTFDMSANGDTNSVVSMQVSAAAGSAQYQYDGSTNSKAAMNWTQETFTFVATESTTKLEFKSLTPGYSGVALDNVEVREVNALLQTNEGTALVLDAATLLANDTDVDSSDVLSIVSVQGALNGTVAFDVATQKVTFTPNVSNTGAGSFTYTISDGHGGTSTATVNIKLIDGVPTAIADTAMVTEGYTVSGADVHTPTPITVAAHFTNQQVTTPIAGSVSIDPLQSSDVVSANTNSFSINADGNHKASVSAYVNVSGYSAGDTVTVRLYKSNGNGNGNGSPDGAAQSVTSDGTVTFSNITQSGNYYIRVSGDDNSSSFFNLSDLFVTVNNLQVTSYVYVPASTTTVDIVTPGVDIVVVPTEVTGNVLTNDLLGTDGGLSVTSITGSGAATAVSDAAGVNVDGLYGTLNIDNTGAYTYAQNGVEASGASDVFSYTITDADGSTSTSTLTIAVANTVVYDAASTAIMEGGAGYDVLVLSPSDTVINFANLGDVIHNIEAIDLGHGGAADARSLTNLTLSDVIQMTDADNTLTITGDAFDSINIPTASGSYAVTQTTENGFDIYTYQGGTTDPTVVLKIEQEIAHI